MDVTLSSLQPHTCPVPLAGSLYTLRQCSAAVRVALDEYEAGRQAIGEAVRGAYDALCEERRALSAQLSARGLRVALGALEWPRSEVPTAAQVAVLGRMVLDNHRMGQRLEQVLALVA